MKSEDNGAAEEEARARVNVFLSDEKVVEVECESDVWFSGGGDCGRPGLFGGVLAPFPREDGIWDWDGTFFFPVNWRRKDQSDSN